MTVKEQPTDWDATLRDQFAMAALPGAIQAWSDGVSEGDNLTIAKCAYQIADAMMEARKQ